MKEIIIEVPDRFGQELKPEKVNSEIKGELIRCGDCKHYKDGFCYNPNTFDAEKTCGNTTPDWYCADGKRREVE